MDSQTTMLQKLEALINTYSTNYTSPDAILVLQKTFQTHNITIEDWNQLLSFVQENFETLDLPELYALLGQIIDTIQSINTYAYSKEESDARFEPIIDSENKLDADLVDDTSSTHKFVTESEKSIWSAKQDALTAGLGLAILGNSISADITVLATKLELAGYATVSSVSALSGRVLTIEGLIPDQASSSNPLADRNFVNSSIATNTANFYGTFASIEAMWYLCLLKSGSILKAGTKIKAGSTGYSEDVTLAEDLTLTSDIELTSLSKIKAGSSIVRGGFVNHIPYDTTTIIDADITIKRETLTNNDYAFVMNRVVGTFATFADLDDYDKTLCTNYDYGWVENGSNFDLYRYDIETETWNLKASNTSKASVTLMTVYNRYKFKEIAMTWAFEYTTNSTGFTAAQWAAINSGITNSKVTNYDNHIANTNNPHGVTKEQVGLGNVDNKSEATIKSDLTGSIAANDTGFVTGGAVHTALAGKVDIVSGKGLSTNDYDATEKSNVASNTAARHSHSNKSLLDTYTQTEANLADAVTKKHEHSNKSVLDNITAAYTTAEATKLSGIATNAQVNTIEGVQLNGTNLTPDANKKVNVQVPIVEANPTVPSGTTETDLMGIKVGSSYYKQPVPNKINYLTTAPVANNPDSGTLKIVVLSSEPSTKYDGYLYIITGSNA